MECQDKLQFTDEKIYGRGFASDAICKWSKSQISYLEKSQLDQDKNLVRFLDVFALRVLSLIICRGEIKDKAEQLTELLLVQGKDRYSAIVWDSVYFRRALRLIFWFCCVLPNKFLKEKGGSGGEQQSDVFRDVLFHQHNNLKTPK